MVVMLSGTITDIQDVELLQKKKKSFFLPTFLAQILLPIFGTNPLSGTLAPSTPRCTVTSKSPLTGRYILNYNTLYQHTNVS